MKRWQTWKIGLFVALCILLNFAGRMLAEGLELPLWLDSFGTVVCAYAGGPICGMIVGLTGNLIYGMLNHGNFIYALTGATLGLIVGIGARRGKLNTLFGTMSVAAVAAVAAEERMQPRLCPRVPPSPATSGRRARPAWERPATPT